MIERQGRVETIVDGVAVIRIEKQPACNACGARSLCGGDTSIRVHAPPHLRVGDCVTLALSAHSLMRGVFYAYLLPATTTLLGALSCAGYGDTCAAIGAFFGLCLGVIGLRILGRRAMKAPSILRFHSCGESR